MYCLYCGSSIHADAEFCESCGKRQNISPPLRVAASQLRPVTSAPGRVWKFIGLGFLGLFVLSIVIGLLSPSANQQPAASAETHTPTPAPAANPTVPPPKFRIYRFKIDYPTAYVVPVNTTDEQLKSLLLLFRQKVRSGKFKDIGLTQPTSKEWGEYGYNSGMLVVFRGEKCAGEDYLSDADVARGKLGPCGYGEHDDAFYQWGIPNPAQDRNGFFDGGGIRTKGEMTAVFQDKGGS